MALKWGWNLVPKYPVWHFHSGLFMGPLWYHSGRCEGRFLRLRAGFDVLFIWMPFAVAHLSGELQSQACSDRSLRDAGV